MPEPVDWHTAGAPRSERFDDIYASEAGALDQARHVFLGGCGLPQAWSGLPQWRILETGFGLGMNFLAAWAAWREDPARPRLLHHVSIEAYPVAGSDLIRAAAGTPVAHLAQALADQWWGLLPGFHRFVFDEGRVLLTLAVGDVQRMLRAMHFDADSIFLDGFDPRRNPEMWAPHTLKAVARLARRGTRLATWTVARPVRDALAPLGFQLARRPGLPPKRDCLGGVFDPAWQLHRTRTRADAPVDSAGHCIVVGAGLAGSAVASSLARRGWQVTVLDAAAAPASGASGLPAGILAPHVSRDDAVISRLTRAGIRETWLQAERLLIAGTDWWTGGVIELRDAGRMHAPAGWSADGPNESWPASAAQLTEAGWPPERPAWFHRRAGWIRPAQLVKAWLASPGVRRRGDSAVMRIEQDALGCRAIGTDGQVLAQGDRVVVAAGPRSLALAPRLPLQPVRGQLTWGFHAGDGALPRLPQNGRGHLLAHLPGAAQPRWLAGATYHRDALSLAPCDEDTQANLAQLQVLHPAAASQLAQGPAEAWVGIRCVSADRRPLVGPADPSQPGAVWVCSALGSRGLSFAALCAELLAARWHGEPLALPVPLAAALDTRRCLS